LINTKHIYRERLTHFTPESLTPSFKIG